MFAPAYSGLSVALALFPYFEAGTRAADVHDEVVANANHALQLDSTQALAHVALGIVYEHHLEWALAESELLTALKLQPDDPEALIQHGRFLVTRGRLQEARDRFRSATRADPFSAVALSLLSWSYYMMRIQDSARVISDRAVLTDSLNLTTRNLGALVRLRGGDVTGARALATPNHSNYVVRHDVSIAEGDTAAATATLQAVEREIPPSRWLESVRAHHWLALGDTVQALAALSRSTDAGEIWFFTNPPTDPWYDAIRGTAGFAALLSRIGLPASIATAPSAPGGR